MGLQEQHHLVKLTRLNDFLSYATRLLLHFRTSSDHVRFARPSWIHSPSISPSISFPSSSSHLVLLSKLPLRLSVESFSALFALPPSSPRKPSLSCQPIPAKLNLLELCLVSSPQSTHPSVSFERASPNHSHW
jgi:hypothetical protein